MAMATGRWVPAAQTGIALALLLWMLAALGLLVAGVVALSRSDVQLTALQLDQARAQAVATGVAHLALRDLHTARLGNAGATAGPMEAQYTLGGLPARVRLVPANGLLNLNGANEALFAALLEFVGGMEAEEARALARAIVEWRMAPLPPIGAADDQETGRGAFRVEEEVLEVPGMTRDVYDKVRRYLHTQPASTGFDLQAGPESLLNALRDADPEAVDFALDSRQDVGRDAPPLPGPEGPTGLAGGSVYCVEVDVQIAEGRVFRQRIWVELAGAMAGLPWRFSRVYPVMLLPAISEEA